MSAAEAAALPATGTSTPQAREDLAMAYDAARGQVAMFGGRRVTDFGETLYGDTCVWDGSTWTELGL